MNSTLVQKLRFSYLDQARSYPLFSPIKDSIQLISDFFRNNTNNKLCLVFPSKNYAAHWMSFPAVLLLIEADFAMFSKEVAESYKKYNKGDKLILNNDAIVEWVGKSDDGYKFKHKEHNGVDEIIISLKNISKLQPAPASRNALSSYKRLISAICANPSFPLDSLLSIKTEGNKLFQRNKICLISKYKTYNEIIGNISLNKNEISNYFQQGKISENGSLDIDGPLIVSNNLSNLALYVTTSDSISRIIIDGYSAIHDRGTDFSDIDTKNISTILITDLSEIHNFENIGNYGFDFFNFTKENIKPEPVTGDSPFYSFENKLDKYISFKVIREVIKNSELETVVQKIYLIKEDDSNNDLTTIKIKLVQFTNAISGITHPLIEEEISVLNLKLSDIKSLYDRCKMWLGDSHLSIGEAISLLESIIKELSVSPSEKHLQLQELIKKKQYDYIICPTQEEAKALDLSIHKFSYTKRPKIISAADVNDNILSHGPLKAILSGWPKSTNMNRILSAFLFSELTLLFYQFEIQYYDSLQNRNKRNNANIKATIDKNGIRYNLESIIPKGFEEFYSLSNTPEAPTERAIEENFDISEFELKLDNAQFLKYIIKNNLIDNIKAKRVEFENNSFIYSTEAHKFLVINELIRKPSKNSNLHKKKIDVLQTGDVIALIHTDRDVLAELVKSNTNTKELESVKEWTELWKTLLKNYYVSIGCDFKKLVADLRKNDCQKHEATIRNWLQDENRIGPDDNADLISIALLTNSNFLNDNIGNVRESIKKMTAWRFKASDYIIEKIKLKIFEVANKSIINSKISIDSLGSLDILKISEVSNQWENIDLRYVNKLLYKEIL